MTGIDDLQDPEEANDLKQEKSNTTSQKAGQSVEKGVKKDYSGNRQGF